jgi:hypothetical protein
LSFCPFSAFSESLDGDIAVVRLDHTLHVLGSVAGLVVLAVVKGLDGREGLRLDGETVDAHGLDNVAESEALRQGLVREIPPERGSWGWKTCQRLPRLPVR